MKTCKHCRKNFEKTEESYYLKYYPKVWIEDFCSLKCYHAFKENEFNLSHTMKFIYVK